LVNLHHKENTSGVHGSPLGDEEMKLFLNNIGWKGNPFEHKKEIYGYFEEKRSLDNAEFENWFDTLNKKLKEDSSFNNLWNQFINGEVNFENLDLKQSAATRVNGGKLLKKIGESNKFILGGSADLAASTKQIISDSTYSTINRSGQNIEFGIREHGMAAIVNGISLHSKIFSYGSTFLVFSDYMRPSIRLGSLMKLNSTFIFTHDSIYLGEDGPTHQPVEHLMSLRLIPNVDLIRPTNSIEIQHSYKYLFSEYNQTKVLVLTRQDLPYIDKEVSYEDFIQGAYEISEGSDLTLIATGSEVHLAFKIKELLNDKSVQIISAPILNKFLEGNIENFKMNNLVFTIELGRSIGWKDYVSNVTKSFSIETFGESANEKDLEKHFNFEAEKIKIEILNYFH